MGAIGPVDYVRGTDPCVCLPPIHYLTRKPVTGHCGFPFRPDPKDRVTLRWRVRMLLFDSTNSSNVLQHWSRRRLVAALLAIAANSACAHSAVSRAPIVLFVCQAGTAKSAITREIFRRRALERNTAVTAISRGLVIEDHVSPRLKQQLAEDGIDPGADPYQVLTAQDWMRADILVWFNPLPPEVKHTAMRDWSDLPSFNDSYATVRPMLDHRIDALLDELSSRRHHK